MNNFERYISNLKELKELKKKSTSNLIQQVNSNIRIRELEYNILVFEEIYNKLSNDDKVFLKLKYIKQLSNKQLSIIFNTSISSLYRWHNRVMRVINE